MCRITINGIYILCKDGVDRSPGGFIAAEIEAGVDEWKKNESGKAPCLKHFTITVRDENAFAQIGNGPFEQGETNVLYGYGMICCVSIPAKTMLD